MNEGNEWSVVVVVFVSSAGDALNSDAILGVLHLGSHTSAMQSVSIIILCDSFSLYFYIIGLCSAHSFTRFDGGDCGFSSVYGTIILTSLEHLTGCVGPSTLVLRQFEVMISI